MDKLVVRWKHVSGHSIREDSFEGEIRTGDRGFSVLHEDGSQTWIPCYNVEFFQHFPGEA